MSRYSLFIDDERFPPRNDGRNWVIARDMEDVLMMLRLHGMPAYISFDHDLGDNTPSGYDIAKMLVDLDMGSDPDFALPPEFEFYVHSQNPIGARNIQAYLDNYMKYKASN
jgi:hypothetical protein